MLKVARASFGGGANLPVFYCTLNLNKEIYIYGGFKIWRAIGVYLALKVEDSKREAYLPRTPEG